MYCRSAALRAERQTVPKAVFRLAVGVNQHRDVFDKLVIDGSMNIFFPGGFAFD